MNYVYIALRLINYITNIEGTGKDVRVLK